MCINNETKKKPIRIAIIDSGIDISKSNLSRFVIKSIGFRVNNDGYIVEDMHMSPMHQHGTIVAMIIKHIFKEVEFIDVNILNEMLTTDSRVLLHSLKKTIAYKPDIIHLSLGTTKTKYKHIFEKIVREAEKNNIIVVAAAHNRNIISYPSHIKGVVGVKGMLLEHFENFRYIDEFFYAPLSIGDIDGSNEIAGTQHIKGTSISAAYITGYLASIKYLENIQQSKDAIEYLKHIVSKNRGLFKDEIGK